MSTQLDGNGQPRRPFAFNLLNNQRKTIDQLIGLSRGILADGIVTDAEAELFRKWAMTTGGADPGWPLTEIRGRLNAIFADGRIDDLERAELAEIMQQLAGISDDDPACEGSTELPLDTPAPKIQHAGSEFCVTGKFAFGARSAVCDLIENLGGTFNPNPRESTAFLVVGAFASRDWAHSTYGRKIERAVELRSKGTGIKIVGERHWVTFTAR